MVLDVTGLWSSAAVTDIDLRVRAGEIVGLAGLGIGAGRSGAGGARCAAAEVECWARVLLSAFWRTA